MQYCDCIYCVYAYVNAISSVLIYLLELQKIAMKYAKFAFEGGYIFNYTYVKSNKYKQYIKSL